MGDTTVDTVDTVDTDTVDTDMVVDTDTVDTDTVDTVVDTTATDTARGQLRLRLHHGADTTDTVDTVVDTTAVDTDMVVDTVTTVEIETSGQNAQKNLKITFRIKSL